MDQSQFEQIDSRLKKIEDGVVNRVQDWGPWRDDVNDSLAAGRDEFTSLHEAQKELSDKVEENTKITAEIYAIVQMGKRFFKGMERIANGIGAASRFIFRVVKTVGALAAAVGAVWAVISAYLHGGAPPTR